MDSRNETAVTVEPSFDGQRMRQLRRERGLSARKLAERTGLCLRHIWRMEAGHRPNVRATTVARVAMVLNASMDYLMGLADRPELH